MLIQFNFKNYKGFKNETTLNMIATQLKEHQYNLIDSGKEKILKVSAIYGANASGKSTVIEAFAFMSNFVMNSFKYSIRNINEIPLKRYAFDKNSKKESSEFEVFIKIRNIEYQYGFQIDNKRVLEEWLYRREINSIKSQKYKPLFERRGKSIDCATELKGAKSLALITEDNTLFLSICSNAKIPYVKEVVQWFENTTIIDMGDCEIEGLITGGVSSEIEDKNYQKELVGFLNAIDINIVDIEVEKINIDTQEKQYRIYSYHKLQNSDELVAIPFKEESSGTQKMFALYGLFKQSLKLGMPIFIDELDAKLHPLLIKYILSIFHSEEINKNGAQLIYTSHDDFTLNKEIFRRDQIWFVEKDINSVANLYSLAEYKLDNDKKVRNDATYNKDYLSGKYGAIPIINSFDINGENENE